MVPVEAKVAAILRPTWPDLPSPLTISLPLAGKDQFDRALERRAETVGERVERPRLVVEHIAPELEHVFVRRHAQRPSRRLRRCEA